MCEAVLKKNPNFLLDKHVKNQKTEICKISHLMLKSQFIFSANKQRDQVVFQHLGWTTKPGTISCTINKYELSSYFPACDDKHWGSSCSQQCKCENGALCDPVKGACQCPPGFIGRYCEEACPAGTFGKGCLQKCKCGTGGSCDKATGECVCRDGFTGTL